MSVRAKALGTLHAFSTRAGGVSEGAFSSLNLGRSVGDDPERVEENGRRFARELGLAPGQLISANQVHGDRLFEIEAAGTGSRMPDPVGDGDGLFTRVRGTALCIRTADCVPVLIFAPDVGAIAAVHAGWRGTELAIAARAVEKLHQRYGAAPRKMTAAIGPSIRRCCYEVGEDLAGRFRARFGEEVIAAGQKPKLDLALANRKVLAEAGLELERIETVPHCTCCQPELFFSHRRDQGKSGRHLSLLALE